VADNRNPYAPPTANVADPSPEQPYHGTEVFLPDGRSVSIGRGLGWIADGWRIFRARPGMWLLNLVFFILLYVVSSWIPLIKYFNALLWPFIAAGVVMCAEVQRRQGNFRAEVFFAGLRKPGALFILALMSLLTLVVLVMAFLITLGLDATSHFFLNDGGRPTSLPGGLWKAFVIYGLLVIPITAATYLAPPLVMIHDLGPIEAMKSSFTGSMKNILPGIVFFICTIVFLLGSMIPLFLGLLISIPVLMIVNYTIYRDIFIETR